MVDEGIRLLKSILGHFVLADPIRSASDITKLNFRDPELQKPDSELSVGRDARRYLQHLQELGEASPTSLEDLEEEYDPGACENFYRYIIIIILICI